MKVVRIPLERILANPWQTRIGEPDPAYIQELAEDIARNGLLQVPVGRLVEMDGEVVEPSTFAGLILTDNRISALAEHGYFVQLAFGHNRLAAYRYLVSVKGDGWNRMPLEIRSMDDEQMANAAWAENEKRRNVTPIERARAIQKRMEDFGWTQEQTSEQLQLARSTIANILRLLRLPEEIQQAMDAGQLSERSAQALVGLFDLPEALLDRARSVFGPYGDYHPEKIIQSALQGDSSDVIRYRIDRLIENTSQNLDKSVFDLDQEFVGEGIRSPACRDCPERVKPRNLCMDPLCYSHKSELYKLDLLDQASQVSGIPVLDADNNYATSLSGYQARQYAGTILQTGCENLRLKYVTYLPEKMITLHEQGFPQVEICCQKREGYCSCMKGLQMAAELERRKEQNELVPTQADPETVEEPTYTALEDAGEVYPPTADDLEELARQARQEKREISKKLARIKTLFGERYSNALRDLDLGAWQELAQKVHWKYKTIDASYTRDIQQFIGEAIAEDYIPVQAKSVTEILNRMNAFLEKIQAVPIALDELEVEPEKVA